MNVYDILQKNTDLTQRLVDGAKSVYKDQAPESGKYPICVVLNTSSTPVEFADNKPHKFKNDVSVFVMTKYGNDDVFENIIYEALKNAGALYQRTTRDMDYTVHYLKMEFSYYENIL